MSGTPREYRFQFRLEGGNRSLDELTTSQAHNYLAWDLEPRVVKISVPIPGKPGQYLPISPASEQGVKSLEIHSSPPGAEALIKLPLRSAWRIENGTHLVLPISVDTNKLDLLRETGQHWTIGAILRVDSAQYFAAYGKGARGHKGLLDVQGQACRVVIEFPHPFIYFPDAGGDVSGDFVLDTAQPHGSPLHYELRGFNPATRRFDRKIDEPLDVEVHTGSSYADAEARALEPGAGGVKFKSSRVIIGHAPLGEAARFTIRRRPGKPVRALNEGVSHPLTYHPAAPAVIAFRLIPAEKDAPPGPTLHVPLTAESAHVHLPKVPGDYPGSVQWWVERSGSPARIGETGAGFQTTPVTVKPRLAEGRMTFDIQLLSRPITRRTKPLVVGLEPPVAVVNILLPQLDVDHQAQLTVDSGAANGTFFAAGLVKVLADAPSGTMLPEPLDVTCETLASHQGAQLALSGPARDDGFTIQTARVLIGGIDTEIAGHARLARAAGKPPAANQVRSVDIACKRYPSVEVALTLQEDATSANDKPKPVSFSVKPRGEQVLVYFKGMPLAIEGTVTWQVSGGAPRLTGDTPFRITPQTATLATHTLASGAKVRGVDLELVPGWLTRAEPIAHEFAGADASTIFVPDLDDEKKKAHLEVDTTRGEPRAVPVALHRWDAGKRERREELREPLDATPETLPAHAGCELEVVAPAEAGHVRLRAKRVIIGPESEDTVARVELRREKDKPRPENDGRKVDITYKRAPSVKLRLTIALEAAPPAPGTPAGAAPAPITAEIEADGELVTAYFPRMDKAQKGTVTWQVLAPARALADGSPFLGTRPPAPLALGDVRGVGRSVRAELVLVDHPVTRSAPVRVDVELPGQTVVFVRELDDDKQALVVVDTTTETGTQLNARLREWDFEHETPAADVTGEILDAKPTTEASHGSCKLELAEPRTERIELKTSRVLIGPPEEAQVVAHVEVLRRPEKPAARIQPRRVDVAYRRAPHATLHVEVEVEGAPPRDPKDGNPASTFSVQATGEKVLLYCPDLEPGTRGTARWRVTGPPRAVGDKSPFRHAGNLPPAASLTDVAVPGQAKKYPGFEIELVPGAITSGDPVPLRAQPVAAEYTLIVSKLPYFQETKIPLAKDHADACRALARKQPVKISVRAHGKHTSKGRMVELSANSDGGDIVKFPLIRLQRDAGGVSIPLKAQDDEAGEYLVEGTGDAVSLSVDALLELDRTPADALDRVETEAANLAAHLGQRQKAAARADAVQQTFSRYGLLLLAQYRDGSPPALHDTEVDRLTRQALLSRFYGKMKLHATVFDKMRELRKASALGLANVLIGFLFDLIPLMGDIFKIWKHGMGHFTGVLKEEVKEVLGHDVGDTVKKVKDRKELLTKLIGEVEQKLPGLREVARAAKAAREAVEKELAALRTQSVKLAGELKDRVAKVFAKQTEIEKLAKEVGDLAEEVASATTDLANKGQRITALGVDIKTLDDKLEALAKESADLAQDVLKPAEKALTQARDDLTKKAAAATTAAAEATAREALEKSAREAVAAAEKAVSEEVARIAAAEATILEAKAAQAAIARADNLLGQAAGDLGRKSSARQVAEKAVEAAQKRVDDFTGRAATASQRAAERAAEAKAKEAARDRAQSLLAEVREKLAAAADDARPNLATAEQRLAAEVKRLSKDAEHLRNAEAGFKNNAVRHAADADTARQAVGPARARAGIASQAEQAATTARDRAKAAAEQVSAANTPKVQKLPGAEAELQSANAAKQAAEAQKLARSGELSQAEAASRLARSASTEASDAHEAARALVDTGKAAVDSAEGQIQEVAGKQTRVKGERTPLAKERGDLQNHVEKAKPALEKKEKELTGLKDKKSKAETELGDDSSGLKGDAKKTEGEADSLNGEIKSKEEGELKTKRDADTRATSALEDANAELAKNQKDLGVVDGLKQKADRLMDLVKETKVVINSVYERLAEWKIARYVLNILEFALEYNPFTQVLKLIKWVGQQFLALLFKFLMKLSVKLEVMLAWLYTGMTATFGQIGKELSLYALKQVGGGSESFAAPGVVNFMEATGNWTASRSQHDSKVLKKRKDVGGDLKKSAIATVAEDNGVADASHEANFAICLEQALELAARDAAESFLAKPGSPGLLVPGDAARRLGHVGAFDAALKSYNEREEAASNRTGEYFGLFAFLKGKGGTLGEYMNFVDWVEWLVAWGLRLAGVFTTATVAGAPLGVVLWFLADVIDVAKAVLYAGPTAIADLSIKSRLCVVASFSPLAVWAGLFVRDSEVPKVEWVTSVTDEVETYAAMSDFQTTTLTMTPRVEAYIGSVEEPEDEPV